MKNYKYLLVVCGIIIFILIGYIGTKLINTRSLSSGEGGYISGRSYVIGSVDTAFQWLGPDHHIEVGAIPDPDIAGITCFYSRAKTGGIKGGLGIAEDKSEASVSCRQTGEIVFKKSIQGSEEIRNESTSFFFKKIRIVRFYDKISNSLVYMVYSDKLIDGSPQNSISAIALHDLQPFF